MNTDKITTWLGFALAILGAATQAINAFQGQPINWFVVVGSVITAALGYWTNKSNKPTA